MSCYNIGMKTKLIIHAILFMFSTIVALAIATQAPKIRNAHEANYAIRSGEKIGVTQVLVGSDLPTPLSLVGYGNWKNNIIAEARKTVEQDTAIEEARMSAIASGNTEGLEELVRGKVVERFNIKPSTGVLIVSRPETIASMIRNVMVFGWDTRAWWTITIIFGIISIIGWSSYFKECAASQETERAKRALS